MKILVGLIEHFGDIVACEPVSRYLRHKYPAALITWAVQRPYRELIEVNPHIDEALVLGCLTDWIKLSKHNERTREYDAIFDLHVNHRVCETCRIPLIKQQGNPFINAYEWFDYGAILEAFCLGAGLPKLSAQPQVYIQDKHRAAVDALQLPHQYCVIHRESNAPIKDWLDEKWQALVRFLVEEVNLPVVEVGATKKFKYPDQIKSSTLLSLQPKELHSSVIDLIDRTSILETAEIIRRARLYVGVDSGPAHLANAARTPGIILLGRIVYFRQYTPFTGFYAKSSPKVRLIRNPTGGVGELSTDEVIDATRFILGVLEERDTQRGTVQTHCSCPVTIPVEIAYRNLVVESGLFDQAWYTTHYPESLQDNGLEPLDHFLTIGALAGNSPGPCFDAAWYNSQRPDLKVVTNPLEHYLIFGRNESLRSQPYNTSGVSEKPPPIEHTAQVLSNLSTELLSADSASREPISLPRIFAFYLPQFHPISENNYGHRPGFTEWDNVIKTKPLFKGHYQPRIPGELGYYDLRAIDVMREQVRLANAHGISGFCFYYYYFGGKKLLYKPIDNYLKSDLKAPFFFLWANENWSRRWDGGDNEVIISQTHSPEEDSLFLRELLPVFADHRYVKIDEKPILAVYKTHLFPEMRQTTERWRNEAVKFGFKDLYLVMVDDWSSQAIHPRELGFDASYEIPSNLVPEQVLTDAGQLPELAQGFEGRLVDYRKFASFHMGRPFPDYKRFRTVMAPWDNTPRYGSRAMVHVNTENDAYKLWLTQALIDTYKRYEPQEQFVFLHSWNEWCEGTYVEPDGRYGRRFLDETKEVVERAKSILTSFSKQADPSTAVFLDRLIQEKGEGTSRSLQAMRQQNMYLYRDVEHQRAQILQLQQALADQAVEQQALANQAALEAAQQANAYGAAVIEAQQVAENAIAEAAQSKKQAALDTARQAAAHAATLAEMQQAAMEAAMRAEESALQASEQVRQSILQSRSWRLTKPLRAFGSLLKNS